MLATLILLQIECVIDGVNRSGFDFGINASDIIADQAKHEQLQASEENNDGYRRCPSQKANPEDGLSKYND